MNYTPGEFSKWSAKGKWFLQRSLSALFLTLHLSGDIRSLSCLGPTRQTGETLHKQLKLLLWHLCIRTLAGSREIRDGCRLCCLSTLPTFLWVNPTIVLRWISDWCYVFCDERALEPLMYSERLSSSQFLKMRSRLHYETDVVTKIACVSLSG